MPNNPLNKVFSVSTMSYYTAIKKHISTEYKPMCISLSKRNIQVIKRVK